MTNQYLHAYDLSLNSTGYAIFDITKRKNEQKLIFFGSIPNRQFGTKTGLRLTHIEMQLMTLKFAFNPSIVVKEELSGKGKNDTAQLAKVAGIAEKVFLGYEIIDINNMTFKKNFAGKGNASKEEVAEKVLEYIPELHFRNDDESDAIGLGIFHLQNIGVWK